MPDCSCVQMTIGGKIETVAALHDLLAALEIEGRIEWDSSPDSWLDHLFATARDGEVLLLSDNDRPWGKFENVEHAAAGAGLAYLVEDDGHYTWGPSNRVWRPGMSRDVELVGNMEQGPSVELRTLEKWLELGTIGPQVRDLLTLFAPIPPLKLGTPPELSGERRVLRIDDCWQLVDGERFIELSASENETEALWEAALLLAEAE